MIGQQFLVLEVQFLNPATRRPPRRSPNQTSEQFIARDAQRRDLREDLANSPPVHIAPSPLRLAEGGVWRVGNSRISLDLIVEQYENGMTPEEIVRAYDTLGLADVHATIDYYRRYPDEVRAYLRRREEEAETLRAKIEAERPRVSREELLARRSARESGNAPTGQ
jgi:uncharacterized protein (DUF433 family)